MAIKNSLIQRTAEEIIVAAQYHMPTVLDAEKTHGKCFNYRREINTDVWIFEDRFELKIERIV